MMGSSRTNEKGKAPAAANPLIEVNNDYAVHNLSFLEEDFDEVDFDFVPDMTNAEWEEIHQSLAQGIPETIGNSGVYSTNPNPNSFQNPQINLCSITAANTILQEVPLLPDWNLRWGQQCVTHGHNAMSADGVSTFVGESKFANFIRPQVNRDITGASAIFHPSDTAPVHIRQNVNSNTGQTGVQGTAEGSFLSLGIGGTEAAIYRSQLGSKGISDKINKEASTELKIAPALQATGQTSVQTLDADLMDFQRNNGGFYNQFSHVDRMTSVNNEAQVHHAVNSGLGTSPRYIAPMQQNHMQHGRNISSDDLHRYSADKLKEAVSTEVKTAHPQKATGQTLGQALEAGIMRLSGFSNQFSHVDRMTSTNNGVGVHSTLDSGQGSSTYYMPHMQQNDVQHGRNIRADDLDHHRTFAGNQAMHSGTLGGNSARVFNSQEHNLNNLAPEYVKPSWLASYTPSGQLQNTRDSTGNSLPSEYSINSPSLGHGSSAWQNYATEQRQPLAQYAMPTQILGGNLFSQRTTAPQVAWVGTGPAGIDAHFPKRLGVEFNRRNNLQTAQRHTSPMRTSLQTTSTGQTYQLPNSGSAHQPVNVICPSIDRTDGARISYPLNSQEAFFAHGQSQNALTQLPNNPRRVSPTGGQSQDALVQLPKDPRTAPPTNGQSQNALIQHPKDPRVAPSTIASTDNGLSQKSDLHIRPPHKRIAVGPHPASHWVQRQKIIHPTIHHSIPRPAIPVTTPLVHPSVPVRSRARPVGPVAARIHPSVPCASRLRPPVSVTSAPVASHITWKDPDATPKLTGYKCFLCKRDLALTSEGPVYQPTAPPPVAILPCGHTFHDQCLENITPNDQSKDPPCIPCAIGEN